jgi:hypothetical protein
MSDIFAACEEIPVFLYGQLKFLNFTQNNHFFPNR